MLDFACFVYSLVSCTDAIAMSWLKILTETLVQIPDKYHDHPYVSVAIGDPLTSLGSTPHTTRQINTQLGNSFQTFVSVSFCLSLDVKQALL